MFELIGDLSVATGKWKRAMGEGLETWPRVKRVDIALGCLEERRISTSRRTSTKSTALPATDA